MRVAGRSLADFWPYGLIAFLYLATTPYHAGLNNPNEMVRVYMSKAIVEQKTMAIDEVVREWGGVDDKAIRDGKLYSSKAPLQSLLGVPAYAVAKPLLSLFNIPVHKRTLTDVLRIFSAAIPGMIFAFVLLRYARRRALELGAPRALGTGLGLALAFGTMLYPYALTFTGHILAAITAGGAYFAVIAMSREPQHSTRWRIFAVAAGLLAGASPFAEYPSALIALPALIGALVMCTDWRARGELVGLFALGGVGPFAFGLWSHAELWGSPFKTGYTFLENKSYVEVHGQGFFGVGYPKPDAFAGSLFSPQTGLFFYSPILLVGLAALVSRIVRKEEDPNHVLIPRALAVAGLAGFLLEVLFISGHRGWRGGWTVGPRYIIGVAPLLGLWAIEAMRIQRMRGFTAAFGAVSILTTGLAAALYPHLSDVYTNPLKTFLMPAYLRGEMSYGIANLLHLEEHAANALHVVPLLFAAIYAAAAGIGEESRRRRTIIALASAAAMSTLIAVIPENDPAAAQRENERLFGFWEPSSPAHRAKIKERALVPEPPGLVFRARTHWREVHVEHQEKSGAITKCAYDGVDRCRYGKEGWQHFGPEDLDVDGKKEPVLFMHPIAGETVRATFPVAQFAKRAVLRFSLSDASVVSGNSSPIHIKLLRDGDLLKEETTKQERGFTTVELALTATTSPLVMELSVENDGARVFGFDLELYRD